MKKKILKLLYPERCKYCNNVIDIRRDMCHTCSNTLKRVEGEICKYCGKSVSDCDCRHKKNYYKYVCAPFYYEGAASRAVWNLKFNKKRRFSKTLTADMAKSFEEHYSGYSFDLCTFVPCTKDDEKQRGFNHAEVLARDVCDIIGIPCEDLLEKQFATKSQHKLSSIERSGNLLGAIDLKSGVDIENMRILLVDDVKTTGATLNECAKNLLFGGAAEVFCLTAAITNKSFL